MENQADSILLTPTRNGWSFVNWQDANGVELSVDNLIDSQTYYAQWIDDIKPALSIQVTASVASKQTATITATDAGTGVAAYYIGKQNPEEASVNFTSSTAGTFTGEITSDSTWYFAVKDAAGNMQVSSKEFCKVMFGLASGETISPSTIVIEKGKQVTLPNPSKAGYSFKGWSNVQNPDIANISTFFTKVKVDNSMTVYPCFVDDIAPVLTVNAATGGIGSSGTITITNATEQGSGIAGYYIGQTKPNASGSNVTFGTTTSVTVNNSGAWYVAAKDKAGNLSVVQSFAYYQLTLNADGATNYTSNSAFIKSGTTVALPTGLTKTGYKADTWTGGISSITVSGNGSLLPSWSKSSVSLMDSNWSCNNNCKFGQSSFNISNSELTAQTWGNYGASWYVHFSRNVNMSEFNNLSMTISATLFDRGSIRVYIDGNVIYSVQNNNISKNTITQNISSYSGIHTITIKFEQSNSGHSSGSTANFMSVSDIILTN